MWQQNWQLIGEVWHQNWLLVGSGVTAEVATYSKNAKCGSKTGALRSIYRDRQLDPPEHHRWLITLP